MKRWIIGLLAGCLVVSSFGTTFGPVTPEGDFRLQWALNSPANDEFFDAQKIDDPGCLCICA